METVPAGPTAAREAEKARTKLLNQVDEQRNARTRATVDELMDRYLEFLDVDRTTRKSYEGYINRHIRPLLGAAQVGKLDGQTLDSFFLVLRTCRTHCNGRPFIEHEQRRRGPRLHRPVPPAYLPTAGNVVNPPGPGLPERGAQARGSLGLDHASTRSTRLNRPRASRTTLILRPPSRPPRS